MGKINRLDEHLSNMIAAGEVVERPMGIVKELVENCIDASASHVEIQILQGGIDTITIIDDGIGMDAEDATLAFERHATSKLKEVNDLWNIHTMGFRGEALPSIASVSHVILRTNNGTDATEVEINYGTLVSAKPCGTPKGTMIEVKNLFQKTPARFKHLKSPQYEFSLISDVVQKFISSVTVTSAFSCGNNPGINNVLPLHETQVRRKFAWHQHLFHQTRRSIY